MVTAMRTADNLFFDVVSLIHLARWSAGRVVLVGDANEQRSGADSHRATIRSIG